MATLEKTRENIRYNQWVVKHICKSRQSIEQQIENKENGSKYHVEVICS